MPKLDEYLRIADAAEYLGVCRNTLRNWGRTGRISEHRHPVNNYRLYKIRDLDKLLRNAEKSATQPRNAPRRPTKAK
jgi:excisionase family DNA binding protein